MISPKQYTKIERIIQTLKESVNYVDILNWLNNFDHEHWDLALEVLDQFEYYNDNDIISYYDEQLSQIYNDTNTYYSELKENLKVLPSDDIKKKSSKRHSRKKIKNGINNLILHPIGDFGKSGTAMIYFATHTPTYSNKSNKFTVAKSPNEIKIKNNFLPLQLILLDDFIGSGKSLVDYVNDELLPCLNKKGIKKVRLHVLSVIIMESAIDYITQKSQLKDVEFYGQIRPKSFSKNSSIFGYRPRMIPVREFCYKYGGGLFKKMDYSAKPPILVDHRLGFRNSQALVAFSHTIPNNTLPIIWSVKKNWTPLFPRNTKARIQQSKELKKESIFWITIAEKLNISKLFNRSENVYSTENIKLICYIRLLKKGLSRMSIGLQLNLSESELLELIDLGYKRGVLTEEGNLAKYGAQLYNEILRVSNRKKSEPFQPNDIVYLPKTFRGRV